MRFVAVLLAITCLYVKAWSPTGRTSSRVSRRNQLDMLAEGGAEDDFGSSSKRGVRVPIESIPGLFNDGIFVPTATEDTDDADSVYYDDEEDEEEGSPASKAPELAPVDLHGNTRMVTEDLMVPPPPPPLPNYEPKPVFQRPKEPSSFDMKELVAMETQAKLEGSGQGEDVEEEATMPSISSFSQQARNEEEEEEMDSIEGEYDLSRALDSKRAATVRRSLSITSSTAVRSGEQLRRITKYDPKDRYRPDPMKYGAYRRWQVEGDEDNDSRKGSKGGQSATKEGGRGISNSSRGKVSNKGGRGGKGNKKGGDTNSFYKAIKKLGSGPKGDGEATGTGTVDPPNGMKNADLGKPVPRGRRTKRVVTAEDIDSIFVEDRSSSGSVGGGEGSSGSGGVAVDFDDDYDHEEDGEVEDAGEQEEESLMVKQQSEPVESFGQMGASAFDSTSNDASINMDTLAAEETPKWLVDAEKDRKKAMRPKKKKKKKLTDDWRFWIGIVAAIGFGSAAVQMAGTQTNINEVMPMNMQREAPSNQPNPYGNGQRSEPNELII